MSIHPVDPRASQERMVGRMAKLRLQGDEAPMRYGIIGALAGAGLSGLAAGGASAWPLLLGAALGGAGGVWWGLRRRAAFREQEGQVAAMLDRVERHAPESGER